MSESSNIKQQTNDILRMLDPEIMAHGSIAQVHSDVSAAICAIKAREREKQICAMSGAEKQDFLDIRAENVHNGAEIYKELESIKKQLQTQARDGVLIDKFHVRRKKYAQYKEAGFRTKHELIRIERVAFSLLKQDPEKTVIQLSGCITIKDAVLKEKVKELEDKRKARK